MQSYEARKPMYFATPATNLVYALQASLQQILSKPLSDRFEDHIKASDKVKAFVKSLGLKQLASAEQDQAHGMTAVYLPDGVALPALLPKNCPEPSGVCRRSPQGDCYKILPHWPHGRLCNRRFSKRFRHGTRRIEVCLRPSKMSSVPFFRYKNVTKMFPIYHCHDNSPLHLSKHRQPWKGRIERESVCRGT